MGFGDPCELCTGSSGSVVAPGRVHVSLKTFGQMGDVVADEDYEVAEVSIGEVA
jgi:hypothetical protein